MKITYGKHYIDKDDINNVVKSLKSSLITQGENLDKFERKLNNRFGSKYCSVVSNGTAALHIGLKSFELRKNAKVVTTPLTFIATASSILMNHLTPDFVDIDKYTNTIDLDLLESKLKKDKNIKAIIGVDYAGHPCDWEALKYLKTKYKIKLINDNCHAMGSKLNGTEKYAVRYADIVTHSYHPVKNFTTGEGGGVLTNDKNLYEKINLMRNHGIRRSNSISNKHGNWYYEVNDLGYNYRLTDFQCALGISQLNKLDKFVKRRRQIAKIYDNFFQTTKILQFQKLRIIFYIPIIYIL